MSATKANGADRSARIAGRIRNVLSTVQLDCECRRRLHEALDRFVEQERHREDRRWLLEARRQRAAIAAMLELVGELEDIGWPESDRTAFDEIAHIFDDIAHAAQIGADAMRAMSSDIDAGADPPQNDGAVLAG